MLVSLHSLRLPVNLNRIQTSSIPLLRGLILGEAGFFFRPGRGPETVASAADNWNNFNCVD